MSWTVGIEVVPRSSEAVVMLGDVVLWREERLEWADDASLMDAALEAFGRRLVEVLRGSDG